MAGFEKKKAGGDSRAEKVKNPLMLGESSK